MEAREKSNRIVSLLSLLALNLLAVYAPVFVCVLLFPTFHIGSLSHYIYFPVGFAELVSWLFGFSINGHAPPDWAFLAAMLLGIGLLSVLFFRTKQAFFWMPILLFSVSLVQDVLFVQVITALAPGFGAIGAD